MQTQRLYSNHTRDTSETPTIPPPELLAVCESEKDPTTVRRQERHPSRCFVKEGENRRAARLRQSAVFCLRWCPCVWAFTNQVTGLSLSARDGHIRKVRSLKARAVCKLFPVATLLTFGLAQELKSRTSKQLPVTEQCRGVGTWGAGEGLVRVQGRCGAGRLPRAQGYCGAAAAATASLRRDLALVFIDSLCKSAAKSRPAAPAPANQSMLIYLYGLLQSNSGR